MASAASKNRGAGAVKPRFQQKHNNSVHKKEASPSCAYE
jgi:hypothetical protein